MKKLAILFSSLLVFAACTNSEPMPFNQTDAPKKGETVATLKTTQGDIKIRLFTEKTPETTKNFIELANEGRYEDVPFHRVIKDFMIQTGDFELKNGFGGHSYKGPGTTIKDEFDDELTHLPYAVSMANTGRPNSGGSQFFIVSTADGTPHLNGAHSVFGQVYEGQDVVESIEAAETSRNDAPLEAILIESVEIETL